MINRIGLIGMAVGNGNNESIGEIKGEIDVSQDDSDPVSSIFLYHLFKWVVVSPLLHTYFRGRIYGDRHMPRMGKVIFVSNHASDFDPPLVANCIRRPIAFMAKEELFKVPVLGTAIRLYGAYPVKRGKADRAAMRAALGCLAEGRATGVFLDGTRRSDGRIHSPKLGAALMAAKAQAPLIPVSLWGTHQILPKGAKFPQPAPITIRIGEEIPPPASSDRDELERVTNQCAAAITALLDLGR
ncbi:MAG: lysophospholipid acyltransferase family protein [Cyanobacteria bacterium P01_C01_bin.89]